MVDTTNKRTIRQHGHSDATTYADATISESRTRSNDDQISRSKKYTSSIETREEKMKTECKTGQEKSKKKIIAVQEQLKVESDGIKEIVGNVKEELKLTQNIVKERRRSSYVSRCREIRKRNSDC